MTLIEHLRAGANDPMWANHCEMPKKIAAAAADEIETLRRDRDRLLGACRRLVNDSMFKDHPEASQMAMDAIAMSEGYTPQVGDLDPAIVRKMKDTHHSACCGAPLAIGPKGGASTNCWCVRCHARFNLVLEHPEADWGQCTSVNDYDAYRRYMADLGMNV